MLDLTNELSTSSPFFLSKYVFQAFTRGTTRFPYFVSKTLLNRFKTYCLKQKTW